MIKSGDSSKIPVIGFFPGFHSFGETYPLLKIAKCYNKLGGEVVIFSHGGEYEYMAKDFGYEIFNIEPELIEYQGKELIDYFLQNNDSDIIRVIKNEASTYHKAGIQALVDTDIFFGCLFAPRIAKIPLISIESYTRIPPFYTAGHSTFPDIYENYLTRLIPHYIKNRFFKWFFLNYRGLMMNKINRIAKKLDLDLHFKRNRDIMVGDYTLVCDDIEFLNVKPTKDFPLENYVGAILPDENHINETNELDFDIEKHLQRPGKHILFTMGSSYKWKEIFLRILKALNKTEYNIIATYSSILNENELPALNENILLKKFISNITSLNKRIDLSIIHGGRGTVYVTAHSGKPVIAIPLHAEQQGNLDSLVQHESAIMLSKTFFKEKDLLNAIKKIFNNYDFYFHNAQLLSKKLSAPNGDIKAAKRILEIVTK